MLDAEAAREERVTPRSVDEEFRAPAVARAVRAAPGRDGAAFGRERDLGHFAVLNDRGAFRDRVLQQDMVELGPAHLIGVREILVQAFAKSMPHLAAQEIR